MSNAALLLDYLFLGPLIEQRLRNEVSGLAVRGIEQLAQATEANVRSLDAFVLFEGESFAEGDAGRASSSSQLVTQKWTVLLAVRNASQVDANGRNNAAGPYLSSMHKALSGWTPPDAFRAMRRSNGRQASYGGNTALYPLTFSITLNI
jgi:hypothetical protein